MAVSANLGFPRFGLKREWKKASEAYWNGKITLDELLAVADELTERHWRLQVEVGIDTVPCNDFAFYDHVLDTAVMVGAVPERYGASDSREIDVDTYFAMARGRQDETIDVTAMEMTKWFDTNYHYIVPEFTRGMKFRLASNHPFRSVEHARQAGVDHPRPVVLGPAGFMILGKDVEEGVNRTELMESLVAVYEGIFSRFNQMGVQWVQVDEPTLALELDESQRELYRQAYHHLAALEDRPKMMITTYFGSVEHNLDLALSLGEGLHLDLVRAPGQLEAALEKAKPEQVISLGVVDGRNVWRTDLDHAREALETAAEIRGGHDNLQVAPSCSLLHCPIDLEAEKKIDPEVKEWLAFGKQKLAEVHHLSEALNGRLNADTEQFFAESRAAVSRRRSSPRVTNPGVRERLANLDEKMTRRETPFPERRRLQQEKLHLPLLPATTIGSFPQTREVRRLRLDLRKGRISEEEYRKAIEDEIRKTIRFQEELGLDVLVHGEFERNDMVEYFGEQLEGFVFTQHGWVQSYGSRGVKPPIIFGDIIRHRPMTTSWSSFARELTEKPMKGMLTGPVTMMQWSFVRDDQPRKTTCEQLALVIRDEVLDLERAGIEVIQIDEPAIREGLPLRRKDWDDYLEWAVRCFRIASSGVKDDTQVHTHMCYSEFNDMIRSIAAMDADVLSIEASRSRMELLDVFEDFVYPNDIGPGVYDIHSPRVPEKEEIVELLEKALRHVPKQQLWVNPDCGLKTRGWTETEASLRNMVEAAKELRQRIQGASDHAVRKDV